MITSLVAAAANFLLSYLAIPQYIRIAREKNIIDTPNERSSHTLPTPRGGGIFTPIGIIATSIFGLTTVEFHPGTLALTIALSLVGIIGFIDDIRSLPSTLRLAAHLACGVSVAWIALPPLSPLPAALIIATASVWLVGCLNIFNFMDGIDGIATCQGIVAAVVWFVIGRDSESALASILALAALGSLVAFLIFNWPPAKVFMGDSSSGTLGFLFGAFPLIVAHHDLYDVWIHVNYGALALFPFLFDGTFTLCRRATAILIENGRLRMGRFPKLIQLTEAHRSHIYQRWVQSGKSHRFVTSAYAIWATLCGLATVSAFFGLIPISMSWLVACIPAVGLLWHSRHFPL